MGTLNIVSVTAPAMMENPQPIDSTKNRKPNRPTTMEGSEDNVSMSVFAMCVAVLSGAYSARKMAAPSEMGTEMSSVSTSR